MFTNTCFIELLCNYTRFIGQYEAMRRYKSLIEQAGAMAVPIFVNQSQSYYDQILQRINGVLIPGGAVDLVSSYYGNVAYLIYK